MQQGIQTCVQGTTQQCCLVAQLGHPLAHANKSRLRYTSSGRSTCGDGLLGQRGAVHSAGFLKCQKHPPIQRQQRGESRQVRRRGRQEAASQIQPGHDRQCGHGPTSCCQKNPCRVGHGLTPGSSPQQWLHETAATPTVYLLHIMKVMQTR